MPSVIHLLSDAVANQIAAGEVIQRPASVIKELMENSIDAGATDVRVMVQDAGRTQIVVTDNGCGMNETDARLAFERHATSKISTAADLYALGTMGFRGEALASIAAVAHVELRTRQESDELGVSVCISGSEVESQEPCATPKGCTFTVRDLFFNVPARRRFLKSDSAELRHVVSEFLRVALAHPGIGCSLTSNGQTLFNLPPANVKQRVAGVAGHSMAKNLLPLEAKTSIVRISGFIGTPETARKTGGDHYFFANDRYMRSAYFNKAVIDAYKGIIPADQVPAYYIYMEVDPQCIDVNVHPQKTEIKFDDEPSIWKILNSAVAASLNDNNILPSIDFDSGERITIPTYVGGSQSGEALNDDGSVYNPFSIERQQASDFAQQMGAASYSSSSSSYSGGRSLGNYVPGSSRSDVSGWENLYAGLQSAGLPDSLSNSPFSPDGGSIIDSSLNGPEPVEQSTLFDVSGDVPSAESFWQFRQKYIVVENAQGLLLVDQHRAHERVIFDRLSALAEAGQPECQMVLLPEVMPLGADDLCIATELAPELHAVGIDVAVDTSAGHLTISSTPSEMTMTDVCQLIQSAIADCRCGELNLHSDIASRMLTDVARRSAMPYGRHLSQEEMHHLFSQLMASPNRASSPSGKPTMRQLSEFDISF